jgi:hypothetical protein
MAAGIYGIGMMNGHIHAEYLTIGAMRDSNGPDRPPFQVTGYRPP